MSNEQKNKIAAVINCLQGIEVKGKNNCTMLVACMDTLEGMLKEEAAAAEAEA